MGNTDDINNDDIFELLPKVFIEDNKICTILDIPVVENRIPSAVFTLLPYAPDTEPIYPTYLNLILRLYFRYHILQTRIIDSYLGKPLINKLGIIDITQHSVNGEQGDDNDITEEFNLIKGLFEFYNTHIGMNTLEYIDIQEKYNQVFNDASYQSILNTFVIKQTKYRGTYYPIPFRIHGIIDDKIYIKPLYPEYHYHLINQMFVVLDGYEVEHCALHEPDGPIELYLYGGNTVLTDIKNHAIRHYSQNEF